MKILKSNFCRRMLATCLGLVLLLSLLPLAASAAVISNFTVDLNYTQISGKATLTRTDEPPYDTQEAPFTEGKITFPQSVDSDFTYTLKLTEMNGFEDFELVDFHPSDVETDMVNVSDLTAIPYFAGLGIKDDTGTYTNQTVTVEGQAKRAYTPADDKVEWLYASADLADYENDSYEYSLNITDDAVSFELAFDGNESIGVLYFWLVDEGGRKSRVESLDLKKDVDAPEITGIEIRETASTPLGKVINFLSFGTFFNETVEIEVTAKDTGGSGLKEIVLHYNDGNGEQMITETVSGDDTSAVFTLTPAELAGMVPYSIWATAEDNAGNLAAPKKPTDFPLGGVLNDEMMLETMKPGIALTPLASSDYSADGRDWYKLTDFPFKLEVQDEHSGLNSVKVEVDGTPIREEDIEDWESPPTVSVHTKTYNTLSTDTLAEGEHEIKVTVTDNARNERVHTEKIGVDTEIPNVTGYTMKAKDSASPMKNANFQAYGTFFNNKVLVTVAASDGAGSGVKEITLYAGGASLGTVPAVNGKATFEIPAGSVSGSAILFDKELTASATDNVGRVMSGTVSPTDFNTRIKSDRLVVETIRPTAAITTPAAVYKDKQGRLWYNGQVPFSVAVKDTGSGLGAVEISLNGRTVIDDNALHQSQIFDKNYTVKTNQDPDPAAGVKFISYYTQDTDGGKSQVKTVRTTTGRVSFDIPASFKGQIFAKAADHVANEGKSFVSPDGVIVEGAKKHKEESHIRFKTADTSLKDAGGLPLYAGGTTVGLTVTDTYSGLRSVEWSVSSPYDTENNFTGRIDIGPDGRREGDTEGWSVAKRDKNLVTEMAGAIRVENNSNNITLRVKITDRAGNTTSDSIRFSIDKTAPALSVTYDNNTPDSEFTDFYNADRTATIVITERNFRPGDVRIALTNTDGVVPELSGWATVADPVNPDKTTHTATLHYTADGDYTFEIRYKDNAGHPAPPFAQHAFTIDKTAPLLDVSYDNNQAAGGRYYNAQRTATITITEHNFETSRIQITGTATDNGAGAAFPAENGWASSGDVHTATIHYAADAEYTFTIEYADKAGNRAADYGTDTFVVDQTPPTLEILGVADKSANNGDVIPVVRFSDTNYDPARASIALSGAKRQAVPLVGSFQNQPNGQTYTFENFERKKEVDDIYTLSAALTDLAGNEASETITFSVNRFGSVYLFDPALEQVRGRYVREEMDVVVSETNVDALRQDTLNIKVTHNGVPKNLVEETDYTVEKTGGEGSWSQYRYIIPKTQFASEGSYRVTLYSVDRAGNVNENIRDTKKAEMSFGIDKTPPSIVPVGLESGQQYPVEQLDVAISTTDNLVLEQVEIYLNDEKMNLPKAENQEFSIPASNAKQQVQVVAVDAAGNESRVKVEDFLVTTNPLSRWYNNTPLFIGTLLGVAAVIILAVFLIKRVRRRKDT